MSASLEMVGGTTKGCALSSPVDERAFLFARRSCGRSCASSHERSCDMGQSYWSPIWQYGKETQIRQLAADGATRCEACAA